MIGWLVNLNEQALVMCEKIDELYEVVLSDVHVNRRAVDII